MPADKAPATPAPDAAAIEAVVQGWFTDKIAGGAIARDTEAYNQAMQARPDLIARLVALFEVPGADKADAAALNPQE